MPPESAPLLAVENLTKHFPVMRGVLRRRVGAVRAVDGLDFAIQPRETLGLVGESGCGKSTVGRVILRLDSATAGRVIFRGEDITALRGEALRRLRPHMQMIFQDPQDSLNPRMTVGSIVGEPLREHGAAAGAGLRRASRHCWRRWASTPPSPTATRTSSPAASASASAWRGRSRSSPRSSSATSPSPPWMSPSGAGGEPAEGVQERFGLTYLFISHGSAHGPPRRRRVAVMYLGKIVELAASDALYEEPLHPYTRALLSAVPRMTPRRRRGAGASSCRARCRAPPRRRRAAASAPAAPWRSRNARATRRNGARSAPATGSLVTWRSDGG